MSNNFKSSSSEINLREISEDDNARCNVGNYSQSLRENDFQGCDSGRKVPATQEYVSQQSIYPPQCSRYPSQLSMCQPNPVQPGGYSQNMGPVERMMFSQQNPYLPQRGMCPPQQTASNFCRPQSQNSSQNIHAPYQQIPPNNLNSNVGLFGPVNTSVPPPTMFPPPVLQSSQFVQPPFPGTCTVPFLPRNQPFPSEQSPDKQSVLYWIQKWSCDRKTSSGPKTLPSQKISVSLYRKKVAHLSSQIKELEKLSTHLQIMSKSLSDPEWNSRKSDVENQKVKVQEALNAVKIIPLPEIQQLLKKRQSKRKYLKRKREEYKEIKKENKAICQLEHSRIDAWLEKMDEQVERARREEDIKKQADYVLSEVFHKKAEAKRMLNLLTTLGKLRNARIHDRESKGEFVSKEAAESFNSIIENLKKRWIDQINGYNLEEQGLRVMLNDAEIKRSNVEKSLNKQILQQWLTVLFGEDHRNNSFQPNNIQELIYVRQSWDQYVTSEDNLIGSSIPNGWILPSLPSNDNWAKHIKSS